MKNRYTISLLMILLLLMLIACEEAVNPSGIDKAVVEAYLHANRPVDSVKIRRIINYNQEDTTSETISGLQVVLTDGEAEYILEEIETGVYALANREVAIKPTKIYSLSFTYAGQEVSGTTQIPSAPSNFTASASEVYREKVSSGSGFDPGGFGGGFGYNEEVELSWENTSRRYYYIEVENIESDPEPIVDTDFTGGFPGRNFLVSPTNSDTYSIPLSQLGYFGTYRVVLYSVNQEYVDLYESSEQDSRNLNEPLTNVDNGLGIVTAFNSDTLYIEVIKE